jgi:hypothetical protein
LFTHAAIASIRLYLTMDSATTLMTSHAAIASIRLYLTMGSVTTLMTSHAAIASIRLYLTMDSVTTLMTSHAAIASIQPGSLSSSSGPQGQVHTCTSTLLHGMGWCTGGSGG